MSQKIEELSNWQAEFFQKLSRADLMFDLFDYFPDVSLFIKDIRGRYVRINFQMAEMFGLSDPNQILGKTDFDFFPPAIANKYIEEDQRVFSTRQPTLNQRSYMPGPDGLPMWYHVSKIPLFDLKDRVTGVAGVKYSCQVALDDSSMMSTRLGKVLKYIALNFREPISVKDMAVQASLSVSQLQRDFRKQFGINPNRYLQDVRIGFARHLLKTTQMSMAKIANECGFYDQSHFSRLFKTATGLSPVSYRAKFTLN